MKMCNFKLLEEYIINGHITILKVRQQIFCECQFGIVITNDAKLAFAKRLYLGDCVNQLDKIDMKILVSSLTETILC